MKLRCLAWGLTTGAILWALVAAALWALLTGA